MASATLAPAETPRVSAAAGIASDWPVHARGGPQG
jgi:hypothetical protein